MFLLDTNCWVQSIRRRDREAEVLALIAGVPAARLFTSIYSVHSLGNVMHRHGMIGSYAAFLTDAEIGVSIGVVSIPLPQLFRVADACVAHRLDFDDAYQYVAAELNGLRVVSLDTDFDRTPAGRLTPAQALQQFKDDPR